MVACNGEKGGGPCWVKSAPRSLHLLRRWVSYEPSLSLPSERMRKGLVCPVDPEGQVCTHEVEVEVEAAEVEEAEVEKAEVEAAEVEVTEVEAAEVKATPKSWSTAPPRRSFLWKAAQLAGLSSD